MKFLCATDFSDISKTAAIYTLEFCHHLGGGEVIFIHSYLIKKKSDILLKLDQRIKKNIQEDFAKFRAEIESHKKPNVSITSITTQGIPSDSIIDHSNKHSVDYIVVGTQGINAVKRILLGSTTKALILKSGIPILIIPPDFKFKPLNKIGLGLDPEREFNVTNFQPIEQLIKGSGAHLEIVHVKEEVEPRFLDIVLNSVVQDIPYSVKYLEGEIDEAIQKYLAGNSVDLMCFIHSKRSFISLIVHKSHSVSQLNDITKPLLVIQE